MNHLNEVPAAAEAILPMLSASNDALDTSLPTLSQLAQTFYRLPTVQHFLETAGVKFKQKDLLLRCFVHRSFAHEASFLEISHNENLEFLGDAVLDLVVSEKLFKLYPEESEGNLSKLRGSIVNQESLAEMALFYRLDQCLLLGKGEVKSQGHLRSSLLCDTFEAVIGGIYLEYGMPKTQNIILQIFDQFIESTNIDLWSLTSLNQFDYKTRLQEVTMKLFKSLPDYRSKEIIKNKQTFFEVSLYINDKEVDTVTDISKKNAQKMLAKKVIENNLIEKIYH